ncbi:exodeoxyribonuclease V subunit gamma [Gemmatimonas sp.]|uniref:exodeoxyribonuclease V subunit gamma n=1 Tax=Gemmatimonas sp. TaxID=1962908 RepID=UPI00398348A0
MKVYIAPRLGVLRDHLIARLRAAPLPPRDTEIIVVQSQGMRQWLTLALADALGCAGSLELPFPARFVHSLAASVGVSGNAASAFSREALTWRLDALLREVDLRDARYAALSRYLSDGDDRMRFGLAARVASRFDDYQLFRHDLLEAWERGEHRLDSTHEIWQAALWRELCRDGAEHGARRLTQLLARINAAEPGSLSLPSRVSVFGISSLPPRVIELLAAVARHTEVAVYAALLPMSAPTATMHPLAAAFGAQGQALQRLLVSRDATVVVLEDSATASPESLLAQLQHEMTYASDGSGPLTISSADASLRVHAAHGKLRELEIIRDQIGLAFVADRTLKPHDVLLLVPDIVAWAPLVETVFGANDGTVRIPFAVADRRRRDESVAAAALSLLSLEGGRLTHSDVFGVLERPTVYTAAGLDDGQVEYLARITRDANVRWGYDDEALERLALPATDMPTWRTGLDRLLLGQLTGALSEQAMGLWPQAGDTVGDAAALAALSQWIDLLAVTLKSWQQSRTIVAWTAALSLFLDRVVQPTSASERDGLNAVRRVIQALSTTTLQVAYHAVVPFSVVRDWLEQELGDDSCGSGFLSGRLTVAALKPMRSVPFKVIAVAGLDDAAFPRRDRRPAFDLLSCEAREGDRSLRDDDRQLFLDLLLAAESRVVLTYSGNDPRDNAARAPSIVLDELLDHLDRRTNGSARATLVVRHPLQAFSDRYVSNDDPRLITFSPLAGKAAAGEPAHGFPFFADTVPDLVNDDVAEIALRNLTGFWSNPSQWFCEQELRLRLPDASATDSVDTELHWLNKMKQGGVRADILRSVMTGRRDTEWMPRQLVAVGKLPPAHLGASWFARLEHEARPIIDALPTGARTSAALTVIGTDWRISGTVEGVIDDVRYVVRTGRFAAKHRIVAWVEHVVMCAARQQGAEVPATTVLLYPDAKKEKAIVETLTSVSNARDMLDDWIGAMHAARRAPLPFFPNAAEAYRAAMVHNATIAANPKSRAKEQVPIAKAAAAFTGGSFGAAGDESDPYLQLCFRDSLAFKDFEKDFEALTKLLFKESWSPQMLAEGAS